jgi:MAF protein
LDPALILASGSLRRRDLLSALRLAFAVEPADVDESMLAGEAPEALVERLSRTKGQAVARRHPSAWVLAADTIGVLDGRVLGKPSGPADAIEMLRALRGRMHLVHTAVTVVHVDQATTSCCTSRVWMREYSDAEIERYVATGDPLDKAAAYAIQHPTFAPVARWEGCYASIMGLPLGMAARLLAGAGLPALGDVASACEAASGVVARCAGRCCLRDAAAGC